MTQFFYFNLYHQSISDYKQYSHLNKADCNLKDISSVRGCVISTR